ncbi:hypothetical protein B0O80DRAFT_445959 [Mortierella sp. GBAus27b]|nr:hypothetical protein BGX31_006941 [Mortierella sp. GBA43]KAI8356842.1 hypothetical protein B0O80DRAFT_445959 [Mortierella sp. GBAus27b]
MPEARPSAEDEWVRSSYSRTQTQQSQYYQSPQGQSYRTTSAFVRRPIEPSRRGGGFSSLEYGASYQFPQSRPQRASFEHRRPTQSGYGNSTGGYEQRRIEGPRQERPHLDAGDPTHKWHAFSLNPGGEGQRNTMASMPRTDPRGRPTPGLMNARASAPSGRPVMATSVSPSQTRNPAPTSPPVSINPTSRTNTTLHPQVSREVDGGGPSSLGPTRESTRELIRDPNRAMTASAPSSSRGEVSSNNGNTEAEPTRHQVATETLISITDSGFGASTEDLQGSNTRNSSDCDLLGKSPVSATVADLLDLDLDFSTGGFLDTAKDDWSEALDKPASKKETQDPGKDKNSDWEFETEMSLIDFSAPDPDVPSMPAPSSGHIDNLLDSMDQQQIMPDLIGGMDEPEESHTSQFTTSVGKSNGAMMNNNNREDIRELYDLQAVWHEDKDNHSDVYSTGFESGSDSDGSYDSDGPGTNDPDPWRTLGDGRLILTVDALESIRKELQQAEVTWEQLLQVKI